MHVPETRPEGLSPLLQMNMSADSSGPLRDRKGVGTAVFNRPAFTDDVLPYETYLMFDCSRSLILNRNLCFGGEKRSGLIQYVSNREQLSQVFQNFADFVAALRMATMQSPPGSSATESNEN